MISLKNKKKRTIYTLAQELKLSPGTISKVINKTGKVSDETRTRVLNYIKEVGYVPAMSARMLKSKSTRTIGIVFTEELDIGLEHSFFSSILQHFKTYIEKQGYELSFIVPNLGNNRLSYYEWCLNKRVDGVYIVVGNYNDQGIYELVGSDMPCISTDMILKDLHTVVSDNDQGMRIILDYIKNQLQKKQLAMIVGPQHSKAFEERYQAFLKHVSTYGFELDMTNIVEVNGFGFTSGYQAVFDLIGDRKNAPEVIIVSSDDIAVGVLRALADLNIKVPDDVQVIGFDDVPIARYVTPTLTTIKQDRKALGEKAAKTLIQLIEKPGILQPEIQRIPVTLIQRESTKIKGK